MAENEIPDNFWQQLDARFAKLSDKIDDCNRSIAGLTAYGCAQRPNDVKRIEELEGWRTKGIIGIIGLAIGTIIAFIRGH